MLATSDANRAIHFVHVRIVPLPHTAHPVLPCWRMGTLHALSGTVTQFRSASDSSCANRKVIAYDKSRSIHRLGDSRGDRDDRRVLHGVHWDGSSLPGHTLTLPQP